MPLILDVIVALGLASAVAGAVQVWRRSLASGRREDLQALAARRGWSLTVTKGRLGREGALRLSSRGGHSWIVVVRREAEGLVTAFEADSPRWPDGTLIATLAPSAIDLRAFQRTIGLDALPLARTLSPLHDAGGLLVLANASPARRVILEDLARALSGWTAPGCPVLVLSPEGLRLRLRASALRADRMERFVDLAFDLSRVIGP